MCTGLVFPFIVHSSPSYRIGTLLIFSHIFCRHWTEKGICWARNSEVQDVDDTSMAFRLLRLHGYNVSPSTTQSHMYCTYSTLYMHTLSNVTILSRKKNNCFYAGVFENFEKDGEFFAFVGQSTQAVTGMYNLNRASQVSFHGEDVLERAGRFSYRFLREREAEGTISDKWIIAKDLPGEVNYSVIPIDHLRCLTQYAPG